MLDESISSLIGDIYAGAQSQQRWDRALDGLLARTDSRFVMVSAMDFRQAAFSSAFFYGADDGRFLDGVAAYKAALYKDDPTLKFGMENPNAGSVSLNHVVNKHDPIASEIRYARWVQNELGFGDSRVFYAPPIDDLVLAVSLHTRPDRTSHSLTELRLFSLLFDHMENAMRLAARPPSLDGLEATILVDHRKLMRQVSPSAQALLEKGDGLFLDQGSLRTAHRADQAGLDRLLNSALQALSSGGAGGNIAIARPSGARPLLVTIKPLLAESAVFQAFSPAAIVRIVDPDQVAPANPNWIGLFAFTPTEVRLATALLNEDQSVRQAADKLGIAYATARVHLANIFAKTGVRTQSQLVRLLTRLGVWLMFTLCGLLELGSMPA